MDINKAIRTEKIIRSVLSLEIIFWSSCVLLSGEFSNGIKFQGKTLLVMQCVLFIMILLYFMMKSTKMLISLCLFAVFGIWNKEKLTEGCRAAYNIYIEFWNKYYESDYGKYNCSDDSLIMTVAFLMLTVFFICMILRIITGYRWIIMILPTAIVIMGLMVYALPDWKGLGSVWVGVILLYSEGWEKKKIKFHCVKRKNRYRYISSLIMVTVVGIGTVFAVGFLCTGIVKKIPENSAVFITFEENLEEKIKNLEPVSFRKMKTEVDNSTPQFSNKKILSIYAGERPESNLYLSRFYSSEYKNGEWQADGDEFEETARKAGFDADKIAQIISEEMYEKSVQIGEGFGRELTYKISYRTFALKSALVPYFSNISDNGALWIEKEGLVIKNAYTQNITVRGLNTNSDKTSYWNLTDYSTVSTEEYKDALSWYDNYVISSYLSGAKNLTSLEEYARKVKVALGGGSWYYGNLSESAIENIERIQLAGKVQDILENTAAYNLYLKQVPEGEDTIQYFLETGHEGYCMHFASSGVLILQELGVPARYASGYVVKASSFYKTKEGYRADVSDRNGHAWAEIYLNGVGWVPFEMTPGYSDSDSILPTDEKNQAKLKKAYNKKNKKETALNVTEEVETVEEIEEPEAKEEKSEKTGWILGWITLVILIGIVIAAVYVGPKIQLNQRIKNGTFRKKYRRDTVEMINQVIFENLKRHDTKNDSQYLKNLIEVYPAIGGDDWERFIEIVQKAAFSAEEISQKEVEFCFKIYLNYRSVS